MCGGYRYDPDCPECRKRREKEREEYEEQLAEWFRLGKPGLQRCDIIDEILGEVGDDEHWKAIERAFFESRENK